MKYNKFTKDLKTNILNVIPNIIALKNNKFQDSIERKGNHYSAKFRILHNSVWPKLKQEILFFYRDQFFTDIVKNKETALHLKSVVTDDAYVKISIKGDIVHLEILNATEPNTPTINLYLNEKSS